MKRQTTPTETLSSASLARRWPKIFTEGKGPGVREGWLPLVDALCSYFQNHIDYNGAPQVQFNGIRQKCGRMQVWWSLSESENQKRCGTQEQWAREVLSVVMFAEMVSQKICEHCGAPGRNRNDFPSEVSITLCDRCRDKRVEREKEEGV